MSLLARAAYAAALAVLFAPLGGRAELAPSKLKHVFLDASFESAVSGGEPATLFLESIALKGKPSCVRIRYSSELIGTDLDGDQHVAAVFGVSVDGVEIPGQPTTHEATTDILPQIVAFSAFACGLPAGEHEVAVTLRPSDEDDQVAVVFRTLEIWMEKVSLPTGPAPAPFLASAGAQRPPTLLEARRAFVAASEETVTVRVDPVDVFHESLVLKGKPSCILVRFSGEVQGADIDANGFVSMDFEVGIGSEVPPHPNLLDLTASGQPHIVTFSAFRCGLEAGPYDVYVRAESADDDDPVEIRSRVLEIYTRSGQRMPALD
jgi:hypothetical protein